ncbi:hypothetical protein AB0I81_32870, partial [Nonomuraea sp. NPDC050404]
MPLGGQGWRAVALGDLLIAGFSLPEPVEAAVRCGEQDTAVTAPASLTERTEAAATATGPGIAAYAHELLSGTRWVCRSGRGEPAVRRDHGARDETGAWRGEEAEHF